MRHCHKILLATDFSSCAKRTAAAAREWSRTFEAEVLVLHVMAEEFDYGGYGLRPEAVKAMQDGVRGAVDEKLTEVLALLDGCRHTSLHVRVGVPWREIIKTAERQHADLIVVGARGRSGLAHMILGSTAERVVRAAPCPVLTVREVSS